MEEFFLQFMLFLHNVGTFLRSIAPLVLLYLAIVNLVAFVMYGMDKRFAKKKKWRIAEANLIAVALLYGALGAFLGMKAFRHKTKHKKFTVTIPILLILQIAFALICMVI